MRRWLTTIGMELAESKNIIMIWYRWPIWSRNLSSDGVPPSCLPSGMSGLNEVRAPSLELGEHRRILVNSKIKRRYVIIESIQTKIDKEYENWNWFWEQLSSIVPTYKYCNPIITRLTKINSVLQIHVISNWTIINWRNT